LRARRAARPASWFEVCFSAAAARSVQRRASSARAVWNLPALVLGFASSSWLPPQAVASHAVLAVAHARSVPPAIKRKSRQFHAVFASPGYIVLLRYCCFLVGHPRPPAQKSGFFRHYIKASNQWLYCPNPLAVSRRGPPMPKESLSMHPRRGYRPQNRCPSSSPILTYPKSCSVVPPES